MTGNRKSPRLSAALLAVALTSSCAVGVSQQTDGGDVADKLANSTYHEEGSLVAVIVGVRPALSRTAREYIPLEIAVVNKDLPALTIAPEGLTLTDALGNSFPVVGKEELRRGYGSTDIDRRLGEVQSVMERKYPSFERVPTNFTPGFDRAIAVDRASLPRFSYFFDMVYFPNPGVPTPPGPYDLLVRAPELPDPLVVRFYIGKPR